MPSSITAESGLNKMKKTIAVLMALIMVFSLSVIGFAQEDEKLNYLILGDSIAHGSGVLNSDEACYGRIVADTNGYNYKNRGISGYNTSDLNNYLDNEDVKADVAWADIISISIGGNDFINHNVFNILFMALAISLGNTSSCERTVAGAKANFYSIIDKIKAINPDATILVQTLYNPGYPVIKAPLEKGLTMLNNSYISYLDENPDAFTVVDIHGVMQGESMFIALDTIHPNAHGNEIIAKEILKTLKELGLGENTEPVINHPGVSELAIPVYWIYSAITNSSVPAAESVFVPEAPAA